MTQLMYMKCELQNQIDKQASIGKIGVLFMQVGSNADQNPVQVYPLNKVNQSRCDELYEIMQVSQDKLWGYT